LTHRTQRADDLAMPRVNPMMREVEVSDGQRPPPYGADKRGEQNYVDVHLVSVLQIQAGVSDACAAIKVQRESREDIGTARCSHRFLFFVPPASTAALQIHGTPGRAGAHLEWLR
jgi:hypothetical protein